VLLGENFEVFWPKLEEKLKAAGEISGQTTDATERIASEKPRDEREILLEILETTRNQQRSYNDGIVQIISLMSGDFINPTDTWSSIIDQAGSKYLRALLALTGGDKLEAIKIAGLSRSQFYEKLSALRRRDGTNIDSEIME
jgi:DNA-binding NtrC family response regulator